MKMWALTATALMSVAILSGCADEFHDPEQRVGSVFEPQPAPTLDEPDPIAFALGDCLRVDTETGVGPLLERVVDCEELHEAQVYMVREASADNPLAQIQVECRDALRAGYAESNAGRAYALTSPANFAYNQAIARPGDEVMCVYVHAEPTSGSKDISSAPERIEPSDDEDDEDDDE